MCTLHKKATQKSRNFLNPEEVTVSDNQPTGKRGTSNAEQQEFSTPLHVRKLVEARAMPTEPLSTIAAVLINLGQLFAAIYMVLIGQPTYGIVVAALILPQFFLQFPLIKEPAQWDVRYNAIAQNFLVAGMLVCAFAIQAARL